MNPSLIVTVTAWMKLHFARLGVCIIRSRSLVRGTRTRISRTDAARTIEMERRIVNYAARASERAIPLSFRGLAISTSFRVVRVCARYDRWEEEKKKGGWRPGVDPSTLNFLWIHVAVPLCRNDSNDSFWSGFWPPLGVGGLFFMAWNSATHRASSDPRDSEKTIWVKFSNSKWLRVSQRKVRYNFRSSSNNSAHLP